MPGQTERWLRAFQAWLYSLAPKTQTVYTAAHRDFLAFVRKPWPDISGEDFIGWVQDLRTRDMDSAVKKGLVRAHRRKKNQAGLSPATVRLYHYAISSFYNFVLTRYAVKVDGRDKRIYDGINPAMVVKPRRYSPYDKAAYLTTADAKHLLSTIRQIANTGDVQAKRDYAMFLFMVATGRRNTEVRMMQWQDIQPLGNTIFYQWEGKGSVGRNEMPPQAWEAITDYLRAAGRADSMRPDSYIFTTTGDHELRFGLVKPEQYDPEHPLSMRSLDRLMKKYAELAGLPADQLHPHCLRHTAAMMRREVGDRLEDISAFLGHSSTATTRIYLHGVERACDASWGKCASLLGL